MTKRLLLLCGLLLPLAVLASDPASPAGPSFGSLRLSEQARRDADLGQASRALGLARDPWRDPHASRERSRGPAAASVYPRVAPAVVVVRVGTGHGTGFLIDPAGWIVTNHHVVAEGRVDPKTGAQMVMIHLGRLDEDGMMKLSGEGLPAHVYKDNPEKDLALLELDRVPEGMGPLPTLTLAGRVPAPGSDCVSIGHPASGLLWTIRTGEVTAIGEFPRDMMDVVMRGLSVPATLRPLWHRRLQEAPRRKAIVSSCGDTFGDSGGPLVDTDGKLIGVTFAIPSAERLGASRLSYHVHLSEVARFIADRPQEPLLSVPDPWPAGVYSETRDLDGDGIPETLVFGVRRGEGMTGLLVDLEQTSRTHYRAEQLANPAAERTWDFRFAFQSVPQMRVFYDTNGDGKIDLVLTDSNQDGRADLALRLKDGRWEKEDAQNRKMIDPALLPPGPGRQRFMKIIQALASRAKH